MEKYLSYYSAIMVTILAGMIFFGDTTVDSLGGVTNFDGLELTESLTNSGTFTQSGASTFSGAVTVSGATAFSSSVLRTGSVTISDVSSTLTAAQLCDNAIIYSQSTSTGNLALPASSTIAAYANCPNASGETLDVTIVNIATSSLSTTITAGSGTTMQNASGTAAIGQNKAGMLRIIFATSTYIGALIQVN